MTTQKIIWTEIDEAPALATCPLLPIIRGFTRGTGIEVETRDISLGGRIIANFPDYLTEEQRMPDFLAQLGALSLTPRANIIKLPNIPDKAKVARAMRPSPTLNAVVALSNPVARMQAAFNCRNQG